MMQIEEERLESEKKLKNSQELSDTIRKTNVKLMSIPEREEREKRTESLFQKNSREFPKLMERPGSSNPRNKQKT